MKQRRSITAAATIQSLTIRSFASLSRRCRVILRTAVRSKSRMSTNSLSVSPTTRIADRFASGDDEYGDSVSRRCLAAFSMAGFGESGSTASTSADSFLAPEKQEHLTQISDAR